MAWTENDLLRMMQTNHKIFGKEILQIKDATDEWIIKYFKSALFGLLDYRAKASCKLFNVEASQFGGIESITPKKIDLTKEQCAEIGNHLLTGIVMRDMYSGQPKINQWDSEIILNYIEKGYSFMSSYKLVKSQSWCDCGTPQNDEVRE